MRVMVAVLISVAMWLSADAARSAVSVSGGPDTTHRGVPTSPIVARAEGYWIPDVAPSDLVMLTVPSPGVLTINGFKRFSAVGMIEGNGFVGIARSPGYPGEVPEPAQFAVLRIPDLEARPLIAKFSDDFAGAATREERWTFSRSLGRPPGTGVPEGAPADSLPRFGEYVQVEELPEAIEKAAPDYPKWARERGTQGTVMVQALVGTDGRVKDTRIVHSVPDLDDYAVACVKQWRFKPAMTKGAPVAIWVAIPVKFTLH